MRTGPDNLMLGGHMDVLVAAMWQRTDGEILWTHRWYPKVEPVQRGKAGTFPGWSEIKMFTTTLHLVRPPHHVPWKDLDPPEDPTLITTLAEILTLSDPDRVCPRCLNSVLPWTAWKSVPPWKR